MKIFYPLSREDVIPRIFAQETLILFRHEMQPENFTEAAFQVANRSLNVEYLYGRPPMMRSAHE